MTAEQGGVVDLDREAVKSGLADGSLVLVDVREPHEFAAGHIPGSGFGRIARDAGGRHWQTLDESQGMDLSGIDLSRGGTS